MISLLQRSVEQWVILKVYLSLKHCVNCNGSLPEEDTVVVHLTLIPYLKAAKELKTKPTQHSVKMLSQEGVHPDIIVCRTEESLSAEIRRKIALFCNVKQEAVIEAADAPSIYEVPLAMMREKLDLICLRKLNISAVQ